MTRRTVVPYDRTRRRRHWSLGDPPSRSRRSFRRPRWPRTLFAVFGVLLLAPPALDAGSALWRSDTGCTPLMVLDGDTVKGLCGNGLRVESIRLTGFDTPEFRGDCLTEKLRAFQATMTLRWHLWTAREAEFVRRGHDRYDRVLAAVVLDGAPLHLTMIESGTARPYDGGRRAGWCA